MKIPGIGQFMVITAGASLLLAADTGSQKPFGADDLEKLIRVERLSAKVRVLWLDGGNAEAVSAIATKKGIVVIDSGMNPPLTAIYRRIIEKEFNRHDFAFLINTHSHHDHILGNSVFPEAKVIGQANSREESRQQLQSPDFIPSFRNAAKDQIRKMEESGK